MPIASMSLGQTVWDLPPLILHPFNEKVPPSELLDNSKAALMLSGLIPSDGSDPAELERKVLSGRYSEIRMLFYLGKDVFRWLDQCVEQLDRYPELREASLHHQSFAAFLTQTPPEAVAAKLTAWGVCDHKSIFSRAIGLNTLFQEPPALDQLAPHFLRHYHCYADALYQTFLNLQSYRPADSTNFRFDLYASGEYSRLLETEWGSD
jgi:hypothetical protein